MLNLHHQTKKFLIISLSNDADLTFKKRSAEINITTKNISIFKGFSFIWNIYIYICMYVCMYVCISG